MGYEGYVRLDFSFRLVLEAFFHLGKQLTLGQPPSPTSSLSYSMSILPRSGEGRMEAYRSGGGAQSTPTNWAKNKTPALFQWQHSRANELRQEGYSQESTAMTQGFYYFYGSHHGGHIRPYLLSRTPSTTCPAAAMADTVQAKAP